MMRSWSHWKKCKFNGGNQNHPFVEEGEIENSVDTNCLHVIDGGIGDYCTTQEPRSHAARLYRCFDRVQEMFSFLTVLQLITTTFRIVSVYILAGCNIDRLHRILRKVVALT